MSTDARDGAVRGWWQAADGRWYPPDAHPDPEWRERHARPPERTASGSPPPPDPSGRGPLAVGLAIATVVVLGAIAAMLVLDDGERTSASADGAPAAERDEVASPGDPTTGADAGGEAPDDEPTDPAGGMVVLGTDGLGVVAFGEPRATADEALTGLLGPPEVLETGFDTRLLYGDLAVIISLDGTFTNWAYGSGLDPPPETLRTAAGIGLGSTVDEVAAAYPDLVLDSLANYVAPESGLVFGVRAMPDGTEVVSSMAPIA